jgi:GST-like protein
MSDKPGHPEGYTPPKVWSYNEETMKPVHGSNLPTAGVLTEKELPKGKHDIQLYGLATPNGVKVSIMLEELNELNGTEYDAYFIHIGEGTQFTSGFVGVNPNSKVCIYHCRVIRRMFDSGSQVLVLTPIFR